MVDLWAGHADKGRTRPWRADTLVRVMSVTKGLTALVLHRLAEGGRIDLEAPVARYKFMELHRKHWPGFEGESEVRPMFDPGVGPS